VQTEIADPRNQRRNGCGNRLLGHWAKPVAYTRFGSGAATSWERDIELSTRVPLARGPTNPSWSQQFGWATKSA